MPTEAKVSKQLGRPGLSEFQRGEVFAVLSPLKPKTPEFREARRNLAARMERTERAIEMMFDKLAGKAKPKRKRKVAA